MRAAPGHPSDSDTRAGTELVVRYQPAGKTMSFRGLPRLRLHISCPSMSAYRAGSV